MIAVRVVSEYSYAILTYVNFSKTVDKICVSNIISILNTQNDYIVIALLPKGLKTSIQIIQNTIPLSFDYALE